MKLEKIVTLANEPVRLDFLAMERSLRAVGCDLPLLVIPYDDRLFDLPPNATWWNTPLRDWLRMECSSSTVAKYQCLTTANYQYIDSDVIFLRNPEEVLAPHTGFITSCGHWHNTGDTVTANSMSILREKSTCWPRNVFNSGQFACDHPLFSEEELKRICLDPRHVDACLRFRSAEQPGLVLLVNLSGVEIRNLTLPPTFMESTWAGDYPDEHYERNWTDAARKPYLLHWAGCVMTGPRPIDEIFLNYLTTAERKEWEDDVNQQRRERHQFQRSLSGRLKKVVRGVKAFAREVKA